MMTTTNRHDRRRDRSASRTWGTLLGVVLVALWLGACARSDGPAGPSSDAGDAHSNAVPPPPPPVPELSRVAIAGVPLSDKVVTSAAYTTPLLSFNAHGDGLAVWTAYTGNGTRMLYALYSKGADTWSTEATLATSAQEPLEPRVASNGSGFAVQWTERGHVMVRLLTFAPAPQWGDVIQLNVYSDARADYAHAAALASDGIGFLVAWRSSTVFARRYDGAQWSDAPLEMTDADSQAAFNMSGTQDLAVAGGDGGYAVAWASYFGDGSSYSSRIYARRYASTTPSGWTQPQALSGDLPGGIVYQCVLKASAIGYAVRWMVTATDSNGSRAYSTGYTVYDMRTVPAAWGVPESAASVFSVDAMSQLVAGNDGFALVWAEDNVNSSNTTLYARVYETDVSGVGRWGAVTTLDSNAAAYSDTRIASNGGGYAVAWGRELSLLIGQYQNGAWDSTPYEFVPATSVPGFIDLASNGGGYALLWGDTGIRSGTTTQSFTKVFASGVWSGEFAVTDSVFDRPHNGVALQRKPRVTAQGDRYWFAWPISVDLDANKPSNVAVRRYDGALQDILFLSAANDRGSARNPRVIANASGAVLVAWTQYQDGGDELFARIRNGDVWSDPIQLNTPRANPYRWGVAARADAVQLASYGSTFAVVWEEEYGEPFMQIYDGGQWRATPVALGADAPSASHRDPHLVATDAGYVVTWSEYSGGGASAVRLGEFRNDVWSVENVVLYDGSGPRRYGASAIAHFAGNALTIAWGVRDVSGTGSVAIHSRTRINGTWGNAESVTDNADAQRLDDLVLTATDRGVQALYWHSLGNSPLLTSTRATPTAAWSSPVELAKPIGAVAAGVNGARPFVTWLAPQELKSASFENDAWSQSNGLAWVGDIGRADWWRAPAFALLNGGVTLVWSMGEFENPSILVVHGDGAQWSQPFVAVSDTASIKRTMPSVAPVGDRYALTWAQYDQALDSSTQDIWVHLGAL